MMNIGNTNDPFYRYKMPVPKLEYQGKKTVISNLDKISESLYRIPTEIMKFVSNSLGTNCSGNSINGKHDLSKINSILADYINVFILCSECDYPECNYAIKNEKELLKVCTACGKESPVTHKLVPHIVKEVLNGKYDNIKCVNNS
jgi:translation initiation factor 5